MKIVKISYELWLCPTKFRWHQYTNIPIYQYINIPIYIPINQGSCYKSVSNWYLIDSAHHNKDSWLNTINKPLQRYKTRFNQVYNIQYTFCIQRTYLSMGVPFLGSPWPNTDNKRNVGYDSPFHFLGIIGRLLTTINCNQREVTYHT